MQRSKNIKVKSKEKTYKKKEKKRKRIWGSHGHVAPHATRLLGHGNKRWGGRQK